MKVLAIFLLLLGLETAKALEILHVVSDESQLIKTSSEDYAISSPELLSNGWKAWTDLKSCARLSVNGELVLTIADTCQENTKSLSSLTSSERALIDRLYQNLDQLRGPTSASSHLSRTTYSRTGQMSHVAYNNHIRQSNFNSNGVSISKLNNDEYSIAMLNLPNDLARVFVKGDLITFVFSYGKVIMKPRACLKQDEADLVSRLKEQADQSEQKFNQEMDQMRTNLQNMRNNLNNMFRPGFPFDNQIYQPYAAANVYAPSASRLTSPMSSADQIALQSSQPYLPSIFPSYGYPYQTAPFVPPVFLPMIPPYNYNYNYNA